MQQEKIAISIHNDLSLGYEKRGRFYFLFVPVMVFTAIWVAIKKLVLRPRLDTHAFWFDGLSSTCRRIKENATTWKALDIIYNYSPPENPILTEEKLTKFWFNLSSVRATRNRLRLVRYCLRKEIEKTLKHSSEVRIISVASGSAQGVLEVMQEFKEKPIKAIFIDREKSALEHSKELAENAGIRDKIFFVNKSARDLEEIAEKFHPQIIEVVGFLEYRPEEKATNLIRRIHNVLPPNGILLVSQINHVIEKLFLYHVANWFMIFRSPEKFTETLINGGFNPMNCEIIYEPLGMHGIAICRK